MAYYSSSYYDSNVCGSYQTPYGGNYDIVPSQALMVHSGHEFSNQNFFECNFTPPYSAYDPAMNRSAAAYSVSSYSEPKSIVYDLYDGGCSTEVVTQFRISYSVSESKDLDFEEYNPTPYGGGYDQAQTYGQPLPHSEAICYPRSMLDSSIRPSNDFTESTESPYGKENVNESAPEPHIENEKTPAEEEQQEEEEEVNARSGEQLKECGNDQDQDDNRPESDHGSGYYEGSNYEYDKTEPQIPSGYGLEAMDLCESLFGYWPCLAKYNKRGYDCQQVADCGENSSNQWKEAADYLFGSYPYEERRAGDVIYSYQKHHQTQPLYRQVEYEENSWKSNIF